jgi:ribonuclease-3
LRLIRNLRRILSNTNIPPEIKKFEKKIGYTFKNIYYLEKALTHRSVQNHYEGNYERLEFLGDAIIDQTVSVWLFKRHPEYDEGLLTKKRSALVNRIFLSILGKNLNVMNLVRIEQSVNTDDPKVITNISANVYEAIVGAIYLDGGFKEAAKFIKQTLCSSEYLANTDSNYKGQLIEFCHSNNFGSPQFSVIDSKGPEHEKLFIIKVSVSTSMSWRGIGSTKKSAEQDGAKRAINFLLKR